VAGYVTKFTGYIIWLQTVAHPGTNQAQHKLVVRTSGFVVYSFQFLLVLGVVLSK